MGNKLKTWYVKHISQQKNKNDTIIFQESKTKAKNTVCIPDIFRDVEERDISMRDTCGPATRVGCRLCVLSAKLQLSKF
jgi:hypothetical protein